MLDSSLTVQVLLVSTGLFIFYVDQRLRGKGAEWEAIYIAVVEVIIYIAHVMYPKAPGAVILMADGPAVNWLRYAGWLVTTPIIIIHMQSLGGVAKLNDQLILMLICNQAMILFGVTGAIGKGASRGVAFTFGCMAMFVLFYKAGEIYSKAFNTYPKSAKGWLYASMINFYIPWSCFPIFWLYGPEAGGQMGNGESVIAHSIADLSAKMAWGYITWRIHHVTLHRAAENYNITVEEYCNARSFDIQFGHNDDWDPDDMDAPSPFALDMVFARRELELSLDELNHGKLRPSQRKRHQASKGGGRSPSPRQHGSRSPKVSANLGGGYSPRREPSGTVQFTWDGAAPPSSSDPDEVHINIAPRSPSDLVAHALQERRSFDAQRPSLDAAGHTSFYQTAASGSASPQHRAVHEKSPEDMIKLQGELEKKSKEIQELLHTLRK